MAGWFAKLLAKGKAGQLSPQERQELARLLNAPILGPLENAPAGFISKHQMAESDVAARALAIDWFARCGEQRNFDLTMEVERVNNWAEAMQELQSPAWDDAILEARNQLTLSLDRYNRERFEQWNEIVRPFKDKITAPLTDNVWEPFRKRHGLDVKLVSCTRWNILSALMENAYFDCNHGSFFFLELLTVYEAGHLACGWHGQWPLGKLVIY
jgi:hypothetical protein